MKVLFFTPCFPPIINGVSTTYLHTVRELKELGHDVNVVTPVNEAPDEYFGAKVWKIPGFLLPFNSYCHSEYLDIYESYSIISKFRPDIIHVCAPTWVQMGVLGWSKWYDIPTVLCYHTNVPECVKHYGLGIVGDVLSWIFWKIVQVSQNRATLTLVNSHSMAQELRDHGVVNEIQLWGRGVDTRLFHPSKASQAMRQRLMPGKPKEFLLTYVGRLSPEKNLEFLAKVLCDSRLKGRVHLALVGDGPNKKDLEEAFSGLKGSVTFTGFLTGEDLAAAYASSDAFIFPSEVETLGLVAVEAMANGIPVIGVNARGVAITVKHEETGYLYEPGSVDSCVSSITRLMNLKPADRAKMCVNARLDAEQWGWDKDTRDLVEIYNRLLSNKQKRIEGKSV